MLNIFCAFDISKTTYSTNAKSIFESKKSELSFSMKKSKKNSKIEWHTFDFVRFDWTKIEFTMTIISKQIQRQRFDHLWIFEQRNHVEKTKMM